MLAGVVLTFLAYMAAGAMVAAITHYLWPEVEPLWVSVPALLLAVLVRLLEALAHLSFADMRLQTLVFWCVAVVMFYLVLWRLKAPHAVHASAATAIQPLVEVSDNILASVMEDTHSEC